jgi:hypothetical protein
MTESSSCPSSFARLRFALDPQEVDDGVAQHVAECADCQRLVAEQQAQGDAYMSSPSADALRRQLSDLDEGAVARTGRAGPAPVWAWGGALAAAASLALVFSLAGRDEIMDEGPMSRPDEPSSGGPTESLRPKGGAQLTLWAGDEGEAGIQLGDSAVLRPGDRVQPTFAAPNNGFVALVLTTPAGVLVPLYPAGREQSAPLQAGPPAALGPSFRLDEEVGTYRVSAYFSESSFSTKKLQVQHAKDEAAFAGVVSTRKFEVRR